MFLSVLCSKEPPAPRIRVTAEFGEGSGYSYTPKKQPCESEISNVELCKRLVAKSKYNSRKVSNIKGDKQRFSYENEW